MTARAPLVFGSDGLPQQLQSGDTIAGLGTMATQPASGVAITGGTITGLTGFGVTSSASTGFGAAWGSSGQVFSYNGTASGSSSGGVGLMFDASHSVGYVGSIAPGYVWLPLVGQASTFSMLSGGSTQGFYQDASGNVGIGTTSPGVRLDVAGPIRSGTYTVSTVPSGVAGGVIYVSNARKAGEASGSGTGVLAYYSNGAWRRPSDDTAVAS